MKTIGLLGGMSWVSSAIYYRLLNEGTERNSGDAHSAKIILHSFDFKSIVDMQATDQSSLLIDTFVDAARGLESVGAGVLAMACNTFHKYADEIAAKTNIPFIDVRSATADALDSAHSKHPLFLGTRSTTEDSFYLDHLRSRSIEPMIPSADDRQMVHDIIFNELCRDIITDSSKQVVESVIEKAKDQHSDGVILGCSELGLLIAGHRCRGLEVFDTTAIHTASILEQAMRPER